MSHGGVSILNPVETSAEGNTGVQVFVQDQTTDIIDLFFHQELNTATLATPTVIDAKTIELEPGHGAVAGNYIELSEGEKVSQFEVLSVAVDTITIDCLMDSVYTVAADIQVSSVDMDVDGSITPVIFEIDPIVTQTWDITRVIFVIEDPNAMDFSLFGSIAALTNGCVLRYRNGDQNNIFNWKSNGDFINRAFDALFQQNTGQNFRGFTSRCTFAGQGKRGVTVRLNGEDGDKLEVVIQDDLTALSKVRMIAQGHVVQ